MLFKRSNATKGIVLTPEDSADLWALRRIIERGDEIEAWTTREIKQDGDFVRPNKGKRIKVKIRLAVEQLNFDNELGRLRVRGVITGSSDESVSRGSYHSIEVLPSKEITLFKDLTPAQMQIISRRKSYKSFVIVAIDTREAGIGILKGLTLSYISTIRSDIQGKLYHQDYGKHMNKYLNQVSDLLVKTTEGYSDYEIIVLGPGQTKNHLANRLHELGRNVRVVDGFDVVGEDGVKIAINSDNLRSIFKGTEYEKAQSILEEVKARLGRNDHKLALGFASCRASVDAGAVEAILLADDIFKNVAEEDVVKLANEAEGIGSKVILVDSSTLLGVQIGRMGGAVATLRFPIDY
ncbi:MAG: hypothetical protein QXX17_06700 [Conexivisphaerales archaeon]